MYDGNTWSALGNGFNRAVVTIIRYNGELIAGGSFDSTGTVALQAPVAKWDNGNWVRLDSINYFESKIGGLSAHANIQDFCIHNGSLYMCGDFLVTPTPNIPMGFTDFAKYDSGPILPVLFPYFRLNCQTCNIESFKGEIYIAKDASTLDTCPGTPRTFPSGLLKLDTLCWAFHMVDTWPVTTLNKMLATDSLLYIGLDFTSTTFGNYFTAYDGLNFINLGGGFNAPVSNVFNYNGILTVAGMFSANYTNTITLTKFAQWNGGNWQPLPANCGLSYGLSYVAVFETFLFASGFSDSCGIYPVGSILSYPSSILTSLKDTKTSSTSPTIHITNGIITVDFIYDGMNSECVLNLFDSMGRKIGERKGNKFNLNEINLPNGIYLLEIISQSERLKTSYRFSWNE